jgi:acetyl esterase/lipase
LASFIVPLRWSTEPRGQLFPLNEVEDFRNAISYLQSRDEVDPQRIGIWGTSFGGAVVIYTAAFDRRAKTVVAQVPVVNGRSWMKLLRASAQWLELLDRLDEDRLRRFRTGEGARVPVTGLGDRGEFCAMPSDEQICSFFEQARGSLKTWRPDLTLESAEKIIEFFPENVIHLIAPRPICIVTSAGYDMVHPIDTIQEAYRKAGEPKKLVLLPCDQLGAYSEPGRGMAMKAAIEWFDKYV